MPEEDYFLISPDGKHLHYPGPDGRPLCGLKSFLGWEEISVNWIHLMPFCERCQSQQERNNARQSQMQ